MELKELSPKCLKIRHCPTGYDTTTMCNSWFFQDLVYSEPLPVTLILSLIIVIICSLIRESVDSLCRDGADTPIVRVLTKALETLERSCSKPFRAPSYPIPAIVYPTIPPK